jgi:hypothetical protein
MRNILKKYQMFVLKKTQKQNKDKTKKKSSIH